MVGPDSTEPGIYDRLFQPSMSSESYVLPGEAVWLFQEDTIIIIPLSKELDSYSRWEWDGSALLRYVRQVLEV